MHLLLFTQIYVHNINQIISKQKFNQYVILGYDVATTLINQLCQTVVDIIKVANNLKIHLSFLFYLFRFKIFYLLLFLLIYQNNQLQFIYKNIIFIKFYSFKRTNSMHQQDKRVDNSKEYVLNSNYAQDPKNIKYIWQEDSNIKRDIQEQECDPEYQYQYRRYPTPEEFQFYQTQLLQSQYARDSSQNESYQARKHQQQLDNLLNKAKHSNCQQFLKQKLNIYKQKQLHNVNFINIFQNKFLSKFREIKEKEILQKTLQQLSQGTDLGRIPEFIQAIKNYSKNSLKELHIQQSYQLKLQDLKSKHNDKHKEYQMLPKVNNDQEIKQQDGEGLERSDCNLTLKCFSGILSTDIGESENQIGSNQNI